MQHFASETTHSILPLAAALNFLGLAVILLGSPGIGFGPGTWTLVGWLFSIATLLLLERYSVRSIPGRFCRVGLLLLPLTPLGAAVNET